MSQQLWFLLLVTMALGGAAVYVMYALRTEAGRKRLFPLLRPLMRVINPRVVRAVERRQSSFGLVHHIGRRSGITFRTPVDVARSSVGVLISLPYGPETNWCRNVLAAGHCVITIGGEELELVQPEVLLTGEVQAMLTPDKMRQWQGEGIAHYLLPKYAPATESQAPRAITAAA